jgi:DNA-binding transcriptional LysR family regulator
MTRSKARLVNLDIDLLRAFQAVAETKSFTRAGARLGRTQSAVSLKIQRLEQQVGAELFSRDRRRVVLTAQGEALQQRASSLLRINDEIVGEVLDHALGGEVRFGAPEDFATAYLPGILAEFSRANPNVSLSVTCDLTLHLIERISQGKLDFALIKREPQGLDAGVSVWREPLVWVAASDEIANGGAKLPLVVAPSPCVYRKRMTTTLDAQALPWRIAYTSPSLAGQLAALRAGLGVAAVPRKLVPPDLVTVHSLPALAETEIALVRAGRVLPVAAERLAGFVLASLNREQKAAHSNS